MKEEAKKNNLTNKEEKNNQRKKKQKNDINEKKLKEDLEENVAYTMLLFYTSAKLSNKDIKKFVNYLRHCFKDNNSNNSFVNRTYALYQYLIEQYSNFVELDKIMNLN